MKSDQANSNNELGKNDIVKSLVEQQAAGPVFREYIQEKNGIIPEVECLRV